jgi:hypothetical protein
MSERLVHRIAAFEKDLAPDEEIGARLASFGQSVLIAIVDLGFHNPNLIVIYGTTPQGDRCTLLQHQNQVNILLVAMKVPDGKEPTRIGFKLETALQERNKSETR